MKTNSKTVNEEVREILFTQKKTYLVPLVNEAKNAGTQPFIFTIVIAFVVTAILTHLGVISLY